MPYRISVRNGGNGEPSSREIYRKQLAADDTVLKYWCCPAFQIELVLLAQIYHNGLVVEGQFLDILLEECDRLEAHWKQTDAGVGLEIDVAQKEPSGKIRLVAQPFSEHLRERMQLVREAIELARQHNGVVEIS